MDNNEFRQEVHHYIDQMLNEFQQYQVISNDILVELNRVCNHNHISFYLAYGTLLGAIRDGGQIPWDYDVDVVMSINDREKLINCLERDLDSKYYYTYKNSVENYPTTCLRICKKGFSFQALHVDVFFLIGCPQDTSKRKRFINRVIKYAQIRHSKFDDYYLIPNNIKMTKIRRILIKVYKLRFTLFPEFLLLRMEEYLMHKFDIRSSVYCAAYVNDSDVVFRKALFDSVSLLPNGLPIPNNYEEFLVNFYGNYKEYKPIDDRFDEFFLMTRAIRERNIYYNNCLVSMIEK